MGNFEIEQGYKTGFALAMIVFTISKNYFLLFTIEFNPYVIV